MKPLKLIAIIAILALALWVPAAQAYYIDLTGNRVSTDTNQLITTGAFSLGEGKFDKGFQIAWDITEASAGAPFHYEYTISGVDGGALGKTLSHWMLEVSNPSTRSDFFNFNGIQKPSDGQYVPATWQPGDLYGIRFNSVTDYVKAGTQIYTFSFDTLRIPVWGDFYAKAGNGVYAYNTGFGAVPGTEHTGFIQLPGTKTAVVPLPGSVLLLGSGFVGLGLLRFRRREKKS